MSENSFLHLNQIKKLNSFIDKIYEQKEALKNNAINEIKALYGHLLEDEESAPGPSPSECLRPVKQSVAAAKKSSRVSRKKDTICLTNKTNNVEDESKKSTRFSNSHYKTAVANTQYMDAIADDALEEQEDTKTTPPEDDPVAPLDNDKIDRTQRHEPENRMGQLNEQTVSKPKSDVSYIKSSIATLDLNNPMGTSTPAQSNAWYTDSEEDSEGNSNEEDPSRQKADKQPVKSMNEFVTPLPRFLPHQKVTFDNSQKKKTVQIQLDAKKRKREERTQQVQPAKVIEAREKRQAVLKYQKQKEDEKFRAQKQKETKSKTTQKKAEPKFLKMKPKAEVLEYKIDHIVEGASSEDESSPKNPVPKWATEENREYPANLQAWLNKNETVYRWFFNERLKTPVLEELFSTGVRMRTRTSSAVWHR